MDRTLLLETAVLKHILFVLNKFGGSAKDTAKALGIDVKTLYNRMRAYERKGFIEYKHRRWTVPEKVLETNSPTA